MGEVKLLTIKTKTHIKTPPPPYNNIQTTKTATILGKQINIHNKNGPAVQQRIQLAKQMWPKLKTKLLTNTKITLMIRILIWDAAIRTITTYGLHAKTFTTKQYDKLEHFTFNFYREMIEPQWILKLTQDNMSAKNKYTKNETTKNTNMALKTTTRAICKTSKPIAGNTHPSN